MTGDMIQAKDTPKAGSELPTSGSSAESKWSPDTVLTTLSHPPQPDSTSPVPFFHILERLKTTKREGWRRFSLNDGESISDHMYRMSILTMLAPASLTSRLNIPHCTKMALVHDMAEALVGDITPVDGINKTEKNRREEETMEYFCSRLLGKVEGGQAGRDIRSIWQEYEDSETLESQFVHDLDKLELLLQMVEYERTGKGTIELSEFTYVATKVQLPEVKAWSDEVLQEREQFWHSLGKSVPPRPIHDVDLRKAQSDAYYEK